MSLPEQEHFALAGGTNLSLRLGHRISVDIDLFTNLPFNKEVVRETIIDAFKTVTIIDESKQSIACIINGIKTDLLLHAYPVLAPIDLIDGIRMQSLHDVTAMKLNAVNNRGAKKDFWDIAALLSHFTVAEMLELYRQKYQANDLGMIVRSMTYFEDAEMQADPIALDNTTWLSVKESIQSAVASFVRSTYRK